jgi:hypothetical protein
MALALVWFAAGCAPNSAPPSEEEQAEAALMDQLRAGKVQAEGLSAAIQESQAAAAEAFADVPGQEEAALEVADRLAAALESIQPFAQIVLDGEEIRADFAQQDDLRKEMITAADDAQRDLLSASQVCLDVSEGAEPLAAISDQIDLAASDAQALVESLGGQITLEEESAG